MTDTADAGDTTNNTAAALIELQRIDTSADQLTHQRANLPERERLSVVTEAFATWERERQALRDTIEQLGAKIESAEERGAELADEKNRLQAQMKTVIAPREAEALMNEIATLDAEADELDTAELEALEAQSATDDQLSAHVLNEAALRESVGAADAALEQATAEIDTQLAQLDQRRAAQRDAMDGAVVARYDRVRAATKVAVAKLSATTCTSCHLDLSPAEIDTVKAQVANSDGLADCPNCPCIIVL